jgi:hypothetical protein
MNKQEKIIFESFNQPLSIEREKKEKKNEGKVANKKTYKIVKEVKK